MLSADEITDFERQGFLGPFSLSPASSEKFLSKPFLHAVSARLSPKGGLTGSDRRNQYLRSASLVELASDPAVLDRVEALLGPDILLWVAHIIERGPGAGTPWHSDSINQFIRGVHVSIALTDMTKANGALSVLPKTHLYRTSLWAREEKKGLDRMSDEQVRRIADADAPWNAPHKVETIEISAGQFFFTWGGLWHRAGKNSTDSVRTACVARFMRPDFTCRDYGFRDDRINMGEPQKCILVRGRDDYGLNALTPTPAEDIFAF